MGPARRPRLGLVLLLLRVVAGGQGDPGWFTRRPPRPALALLLQGDYGEEVGLGEGAVAVDTTAYDLVAPAEVEDLLRHAESSVKALRSVLNIQARITRASLEDSRAACLLLARIAYADWWHGPEASGSAADDPDDDVLSDRRFEQLLEAAELNLDAMDVVDTSRLIFALQRHGHYDADLRQRAFEHLAAGLARDGPAAEGAPWAEDEPAPLLCSALELATVMCVLRIQLTTPPQILRQQLAYSASQGTAHARDRIDSDGDEAAFSWWDACCRSFQSCSRHLSGAFAGVVGPGGPGGGASWYPGHVTTKALACAAWATDAVLSIEGFTSQQLEDIANSVALISDCSEHACTSGAMGHKDVETAVLLTKCNIDAANAAAIPALTAVLEMLNPQTPEGRAALARIGDARFVDFVSMIQRASETMPGKSRKALMDTLDPAFRDDLLREARRRIAGSGLGLGDKKRSVDLQTRLLYRFGKLGVAGEEATALCAQVLLFANSILEADDFCRRTGALPLPTKTAARLVYATGSILRNDESPGQVLPALAGRLCGGMIVTCVHAKQPLSPDDVADMLEGLTMLGHRSRPFENRLRLLFLREHTDGVCGMEKTVMLRGLSRLAEATSRANLQWPRLYMTLLDTLQGSDEVLESFRPELGTDADDPDLRQAPGSTPRFDHMPDLEPQDSWSHRNTESGLTIAERIRLDRALGVAGWSGLKNDLLEPLFGPGAGEIEDMNPSTLASLVSAVADGATSAAADFVDAMTVITTSDQPRTIARALQVTQAARMSFRFRMFAFEKLLRVLKPNLLTFSPEEIADIAGSFAIVIASAAKARSLDTQAYEPGDGAPAGPDQLWRVPLPEGLLKRFCIEAERWATTFTEEELATLSWCAYESMSYAERLTARYAREAGFVVTEEPKDHRGERASGSDIRAVLNAITTEVKSRTEAQRGGRFGAFHLGSLKAFMAAISDAVGD